MVKLQTYILTRHLSDKRSPGKQLLLNNKIHFIVITVNQVQKKK